MASEPGTSHSTALRCYVSAVSALGVALFGWCVTRVVTVGVPVEWWMFAALTFISGRITLNVPGVEATFTVSEVFAFASVLLFGPEAGAVTLALDSLVLAWHRRMGVTPCSISGSCPYPRAALRSAVTALLPATAASRRARAGRRAVCAGPRDVTRGMLHVALGTSASADRPPTGGRVRGAN